MKKISIIICCVLGVMAIVGGIFLLSLPKEQAPKISKNKIVFSYSETQGFYSNKKHVGTEKVLENYTLTISNIAGVSFENPEILSSTNIIKSTKIEGMQIVVDFNIILGNEFSFTLQTNNFETATDTKSATEYIQSEHIQLKLATTQNGEYENFSNNTIYVVDDQYKAQALQDGVVIGYFIKADYYATPPSNFEISVAESGLLNYNSTTNLLTAKRVDKKQESSYVTVTATDGSGAKKQFSFATSYVEATSIANLPNKTISLDVYKKPSITLEPLALPVYAKVNEIIFETTDNKIFDVENNFTLKAVSSGEATLIIKLNGIQFETIVVSVTATANPVFIVSLQDSTKSMYGEKISFENDTCTLHAQDLTDLVQLNFNVEYQNISVKPEFDYESITDNNNIEIEVPSESGFGIGENPVPFSIFVNASNYGKLELKIIAKTVAGTFEKDLTIILVNS